MKIRPHFINEEKRGGTVFTERRFFGGGNFFHLKESPFSGKSNFFASTSFRGLLKTPVLRAPIFRPRKTVEGERERGRRRGRPTSIVDTRALEGASVGFPEND